jgi:hypothetical protein
LKVSVAAPEIAALKLDCDAKNWIAAFAGAATATATAIAAKSIKRAMLTLLETRSFVV